MIRIQQLYMDCGKMREESLTDVRTPYFSWSVCSDRPDDRQCAFCAEVSDAQGKVLWHTGWCDRDEQGVLYAGDSLPEGDLLHLRVSVKGRSGEASPFGCASFRLGTVENWRGKWIKAPDAVHEVSYCFRKDFTVDGEVDEALLYVCGIGYHVPYLNGFGLTDSLMDPATSNYAKTCYYRVLSVAPELHQGKNTLGVEVADGWRYNETDTFRNLFIGRKIEFFGDDMLNAMLRIRYRDGREVWVVSDESWICKKGAYTSLSIFGGAKYDARLYDPYWAGDADTWHEPVGFAPVAVCQGPGGELRPMTLEPISVQKCYPVKSVFSVKPGVYILDFGQNIAGAASLQLPKHMEAGRTICLRFGEMLDEDGGLYNLPLRYAEQIDTYTAAGDERDAECFMPGEFTYHGFRYCEVTGYPEMDREDIFAVAYYTDIDKKSSFSCGSALVTRIHENCVATERSNLHSILTDCPQRDERMAWMNDATVRFEETPYNFDIGRLFPKVIRDIRNEQRPDGAFTCCAPFIYGNLPADPVCSSYLVAGMSALMHTGNIALIRDSFDGFAAWENLLLSRSDNYIVNYSYYGDWAGPAYACVDAENAFSKETPGIFMSTGYSYFNCVTLAKFARLLGRTADEEKYGALAENIREAMLNQWFDRDSGRVATGSQACQAFALWLGILPEECRAGAAKVMRDNLVNNNYRITTGNLCTRYLMDMLAEYGYVDDAWRVLTSEEYPSYGYMIQNEATTVWERFELKKEPGMNSHNHPMYAAVDYWFYTHLCGIQPTKPGFAEFSVRPCYPGALLSAHATLDTVRGQIDVRWVRRFWQYSLYVSVPFGAVAHIDTPAGVQTVGSGSHVYRWDVPGGNDRTAD